MNPSSGVHPFEREGRKWKNKQTSKEGEVGRRRRRDLRAWGAEATPLPGEVWGAPGWP